MAVKFAQCINKPLVCGSPGRYFDEISQDTGKYCFGVEDTLKALEMGAVEILIVYENLDTMRYILRVHGAESNGAENGTCQKKLRDCEPCNPQP